MEKLNIAEILRHCPKGMELDCVMYDGLEFDRIDEHISPNYSIVCRVKTESGQYNFHTFTKYGSYSRESYSKCVIFPKGKTTWKGFVPPRNFKDGDIVATKSGRWIGITTGGESRKMIPTYCVINDDNELNIYFNKKECWTFDRLATEEEKQKLFDAIKANGYKWNAETKTLEKLIGPKFKVGDRIKWIKTGNIHEIIKILSNCYIANYLGSDITILFDRQDEYELVPNKFDITTLKPFDKVLVRDNDKMYWSADIYSHHLGEDKFYQFQCIGLTVKQCIPYENNEHLLGTTNNCEEYFKTWE